MIVCLCHKVSDRDIAQAVRSGVRCFELLQDELCVASSCACCHDCAREVFDKALAEPRFQAECQAECRAESQTSSRRASLA